MPRRQLPALQVVDKSRYSKGDNSLQREIQVLCKVSHQRDQTTSCTSDEGKAATAGPSKLVVVQSKALHVDGSDHTSLCYLPSCPLCLFTPLHRSDQEREYCKPHAQLLRSHGSACSHRLQAVLFTTMYKGCHK